MRKGPWYITRSAVDDFLRITRGTVAVSDRVWEAAEDALMALAAKAHYVRDQESGAQLWRGGLPLRLRYIVSTAERAEGGLPQLVRVEASYRAPRS